MEKQPPMFLADRKRALASLQREVIEEFLLKYSIPVADDDRLFWGAVHKARVECSDLTEHQREHSRNWLMENGFKSFF